MPRDRASSKIPASSFSKWPTAFRSCSSRQHFASSLRWRCPKPPRPCSASWSPGSRSPRLLLMRQCRPASKSRLSSNRSPRRAPPPRAAVFVEEMVRNLARRPSCRMRMRQGVGYGLRSSKAQWEPSWAPSALPTPPSTPEGPSTAALARPCARSTPSAATAASPAARPRPALPPQLSRA